MSTQVRSIAPTPSSTRSLHHKTSTSYINGSSSATRTVTHQSSRNFYAANPPQPTSSKKFQWVKGELIGQGSYGRVFLGLTTGGELMAVKQVETPQTASDRVNPRQLEVVEALKLESRALQLLGDHENIVQYLGFEETPATLNIFLEYIPGGTISSCLSRHGRFEQNVCKHFTRQIAAGLEFLHSKKVLHRDLKGDNILVETSGICKISDFGISKFSEAQDNQAFTELRGTVFWMAPEVVDARKRGYDSKVDIWSLGCVLLEMWSGERPWAGEEVISVMLKLYKDKLPPPLPPDVKAELSELALDFHDECFAQNPQHRPNATVLRQHPYLSLPPDWTFSLSDLERSTRQSRKKSKTNTSIKHRNSSAPASRHRRAPTSDTLLPPLPPKPNSEATIRPADHTRLASMDTAVVYPPPSKPPADLPAIVFITPPPSPRISSRSSSFSTTSGSTPSSVSAYPPRKRGNFRVANPDPTPEDRRAVRFRPPYVFTPPPLPPSLPPPLPIPLSSRDERRLAPAVSMQNLASPIATTSTTSSQLDYSDSDSDSYGMWKKPPEALKTSPSKAQKYARRQSIIETKRNTTWAPRPEMGDVYSHLDEFFPKVDLDQPLDTLTDRQRRTKSIRMQAAEINRLNQEPGLHRRATRLWGHQVEEVRNKAS
ncbi:Protein kinase domain-containing protein [Mycena indigotica]|uniref:Protein kinase domain-containing protein n=1 Tax=Mycena indigotica TaxID=2126181 RepID=A0A8H6SWT5_9AGAR|nr:Protein kinase domain-containing protein [Mycena indigotica]KAF7306861.1 Protein kinase domain-containing protein [Mycena indigotica]